MSSQKHINPREWIEVSRWAVKTKSISTAAKVACKIRVLGGHGWKVIDGKRVEWYGLGYFRLLVKQQAAERD